MSCRVRRCSRRASASIPRAWAAGGYEGALWVYDLASRKLVARLDVGAQPSCVNGIAFGPEGEAYVTDSLIPTLFRVQGDPLGPAAVG